MSSIVKTNLDLPHAYQCEVLRERPSESGDIYYYPGASTVGGRDGLLLRFVPTSGRPWIGVFAFGDLAFRALSGAFASADPIRMLVVARGEGYLINVTEPKDWESVPFAPITDTRPVPDHLLLLVITPWEIGAYGASGFVWSTGRIAMEGITLDGVLEGRAMATVNPDDEPARLLIDLQTGETLAA